MVSIQIYLPYFIIGLLFTYQHALGQCRSSDVWTKAWASCTPTANPNTSRGESHWLQYDFGQVYLLEDLHIWNANELAYLDQGAKEIAIDYSEDGQAWTSAGTFAVERGSGEAFYSGTEVTSLADISARYVLLTITDTWGNDGCARLTEVMFNLRNAALSDSLSLLLYPNPANTQVNLIFEATKPERLEANFVNLMGQSVLQQQLDIQPGDRSIRFEVSSLVPGLYVVQLLGQDRRLIGQEKVVIRR